MMSRATELLSRINEQSRAGSGRDWETQRLHRYRSSPSSMFRQGDRVQTHPATNAWMQGDRFGTVKRIGRKHVHVQLDASGATRRFHPDNLMHAV